MEAKIDEKFTRDGDPTIQWFDAKCLALEGDMVITSPNVDYVPYLTLGRSRLIQRADGRFGPQDFTLMPQKFSIKYPHSGLIPRLPLDRDHRAAPLWLTPGREQFIVCAGTAFNDVGNLCQEWVGKVEPLVKELSDGVAKYEASNPRDYVLAGALTNLKQTMSRLKFNPYTGRDLINDYAYMCRCALDVHAHLKFLLHYQHLMVAGNDPAPVVPSALGAWTDDPEVVQFLVATGIPVWFVRSRFDFTAAMGSRFRPNVQRVARMGSVPSWVVKGLLKDAKKQTVPSPIFYEGLGGDNMHLFSRRHIFVGVHTSRALADLPDAPTVEGLYDERTFRDVTAPLDPYLTTEERNKVISQRVMKAVKMPSILGSSSGEPSSSGSAQSSALGSSSASISTSNSASSTETRRHGGKKGKGKRVEPYPSAQSTSSKAPRDKWVDPDSDIIPPAIPTWQDALRLVDRRPQNLEPNRPQYNGYHFPDPAMFASTRNLGQFMLNWLASRQAWLARVSTSDRDGEITGSPQMWREFLGAKYDQSNVADTFTARCRQQTLNLFGVNMDQPPNAVYWQEMQIMTHDTDSPRTRRAMCEVVWDAFEHSFRFELRALDRLVCPGEWERDADGREAMVADVFGGNFLVGSMPTENVGLAAEEYRDRVGALEALRKLMVSWKNAPSNIINHALHPDDPALDHAQTYLGMEGAVSQFYCQTFFNWYARPPVLLHRIPLREE
ncbi:hypothetical protein PLICRDRAFT_180852 [Plicaturopsis crispa FD-325 SS-3]|uniref:Uncharacterized protein n=1 Tax=Plicaturopsis crispa FD-325 SS-3 TaxID=944288 RepID=A0A0C9SK21_PLICR|nr:hypothetical protein PLICRDRAFT_180852 [Plicaturopsis crispa FD-325 SS-3]